MLRLSKASARQPRKWTLAEDQKLREEVEAQKNEGEVKDWCRIAAKLPGRTNKDCRKRWLNSVAGGLKKGQWSKSEDLQLARGVDQFGQRWTLVAEVVGSRSADQCAKRWQQSLDPELDRSEWRESEDQVLIEAVQRLGRHWKDIQRHHFPGRSKNCIKNRYTVIIRRYQNSGIPLPRRMVASAPATPNHRLSGYLTPDEDGLAYAANLYDDLLTTRTQVSTPETHHSWSLDEEPFTNWSSPESFHLQPAVALTDFSRIHHQVPRNANGAQWNWTTVSMDSPPLMSMGPMPTYPPNFGAQALPYTSYPTMQNLVAHNSPASPPNRSGFAARGPTSSPGLVNAPPPYQDVADVTRFAKYGMHNEPSYRF
ncbi:hypothetical protein M011DRAFT_476982 [Sporormia fimetaria CBS 119925]|uniref:Homeodomain-like protein n=1 Tax=Sporormia fimetaria CBS 119925 TaxID=1340428 RepID=A0A6A6VDL5_9PLEO|nr:hypothetical protein M011DRAFT_476982 [Sporormia fimetaria CBS 119925]